MAQVPNGDSASDNWRERMDRVERTLERIAERHESLAGAVEILSGMHKESERRMAKLEEHMANLTLTMDRLANIVIRHEERLDALDGGDT
jgi:hypothetical protein